MFFSFHIIYFIPTNISYREAASIPTVGFTSYMYLVDFANVKKGDHILIHGGFGGVGSFAIQLAKHLGAIVATTTSTKNIDFVTQLGADYVIDYTKEDFSKMQNRFDIVFDTVGGRTHIDSYKIVKPGGALMTIAAQPDAKLAGEKNIHIGTPKYNNRGKRLADISEVLKQGGVKPIVGHIFPLDQIAQAHQLNETRHARGKIIIEVKKENG